MHSLFAQDNGSVFWTPPRPRRTLASEEEVRNPNELKNAATMDCDESPVDSRPSPIAFTSENEFKQTMEGTWKDITLPVLDLEHLPGPFGFSTPPRKSFSKPCPHGQSSVLRYYRPPWNSPDAMDLEWTTEAQQENMHGPPPPPSPSRRICFVSLENFKPAPIFGDDFPAVKPQKSWNQQNRLKRIIDENGEEEQSIYYDPPKLTMKRARYYHDLGDTLSLSPVRSSVFA